MESVQEGAELENEGVESVLEGEEESVKKVATEGVGLSLGSGLLIFPPQYRFLIPHLMIQIIIMRE